MKNIKKLYFILFLTIILCIILIQKNICSFRKNIENFEVIDVNTTDYTKIIINSNEDKDTTNMKNFNINDYILKSSIPPPPKMPDLKDYVHKSLVPDLTDYVLKTSIKPTTEEDLLTHSVNDYILKTKINPSLEDIDKNDSNNSKKKKNNLTPIPTTIPTLKPTPPKEETIIKPFLSKNTLPQIINVLPQVTPTPTPTPTPTQIKKSNIFVRIYNFFKNIFLAIYRFFVSLFKKKIKESFEDINPDNGSEPIISYTNDEPIIDEPAPTPMPEEQHYQEEEQRYQEEQIIIDSQYEIVNINDVDNKIMKSKKDNKEDKKTDKIIKPSDIKITKKEDDDDDVDNEPVFLLPTQFGLSNINNNNETIIESFSNLASLEHDDQLINMTKNIKNLVNKNKPF